MAATGPLSAGADGAPAQRSEGTPQAQDPASTKAMSVEQRLQEAGLELLGNCQKMSGRGPGLLQHSAMLEDFTPQELDTLGEARNGSLDLRVDW